MNAFNLISNINWLVTILLTVFSFVLGTIWHQPFMFGKFWKQENYPNNMPVKVNAPLVFGGTALMHFMSISALSAVTSGQGGANGLIFGLLISIVWILPAMSGTYLFASRSLKLLAIDAGMYIILFAFCGFILGIF